MFGTGRAKKCGLVGRLKIFLNPQVVGEASSAPTAESTTEMVNPLYINFRCLVQDSMRLKCCCWLIENVPQPSNTQVVAASTAENTREILNSPLNRNAAPCHRLVHIYTNIYGEISSDLYCVLQCDIE